MNSEINWNDGINLKSYEMNIILLIGITYEQQKKTLQKHVREKVITSQRIAKHVKLTVNITVIKIASTTSFSAKY